MIVPSDTACCTAAIRHTTTAPPTRPSHATAASRAGYFSKTVPLGVHGPPWSGREVGLLVHSCLANEASRPHSFPPLGLGASVARVMRRGTQVASEGAAESVCVAAPGVATHSHAHAGVRSGAAKSAVSVASRYHMPQPAVELEYHECSAVFTGHYEEGTLRWCPSEQVPGDRRPGRLVCVVAGRCKGARRS